MILRIILAFLAAPLAPALTVIAIAQIPGVSKLNNPGINLAVNLAFFSPLVAYPAMVVFGIPMFFWFCAKGWLSLGHATTGGGVVGVMAAVTYFSYILVTSTGTVAPFKLGEALVVCAILAAFGLLMGAAFWFMAFWKPKHGSAQQE